MMKTKPIVKKVYLNKSNDQKLVAIPKDSPLEEGDYVVISGLELPVQPIVYNIDWAALRIKVEEDEAAEKASSSLPNTHSRDRVSKPRSPLSSSLPSTEVKKDA